MKKAKYALYFLAALATLAIVVAAYLVLTFDPNKYKPLLISYVKEQTQRTLAIEGDIKLALFPKLGIDLGKVSLSERNSPEEFAAVNQLRLYLALLPLLHKEVVVDDIHIDGLRARIVKHRDGTTNYDDLAKGKKEEKKKEEGAMPFALDVSGVKITNSAFTLQDEEKGRTFSVSSLEVSTGRLAGNVPTRLETRFRVQGDKPKIDASVHLATGLTLDLKAQHYALMKLNVEAKGEAAGITGLQMTARGDVDSDSTSKSLVVQELSVSLKGKKGTDDLEMKLDVPRLQLSHDKVTSEKINLRAMLTQPGGRMDMTLGIPALESTPRTFQAESVAIDINGTRGDNAIKGSIATPVKGDLETKYFDLPAIRGDIGITNPKLPKGSMTLAMNGKARLELAAEKVSIDLTTKVEGDTIISKLGVSGFDTPYYTFDIAIDRLDTDRWLPPVPVGGQKQIATVLEPKKSIDFSAIRTLKADGKLRIDQLKTRNLKATNIRIGLKAAGGSMIVSPMSASLYDGTTSGSLTVNAVKTPHIGVRQDFKKISIGPLMRDVLNKDVLEGKGNVSLDINGEGDTETAIRKSLDGILKINLRDGAIKGINIPGALRSAKAKLGMLKGEEVQETSAMEKTDFTEMNAQFSIKNGVARGDLNAKSPLLRLAGAGDIDIGEEKLDYLLRATIVGTLEGQEGKELAALRGVTVPVRISGPFAAPKARLDFNSLAEEAVKQKLGTTTEEIKKKAGEVLEKGLKGLFR
ncbi:MAG: AsmA family protein [Nitrospirota bacterium]|nr:AsmA family protein [Nitrospirota bacterium]